MAESIEKKFLAGLKFRTAKDGKPVERALTAADVLDWKDNGATVTIITADGRKYFVDKKGAEKNKTEEGQQ